MMGSDFNTIRSSFETLRSGSLAHYPVFYENDPNSSPPDSGPWMRVTTLPGESHQSSFGTTKTYRYPFVLVVSVFDDIGSGTKNLQDIADVIEGNFRGTRLSGIAFLVPYVTKLPREEKWVHWNVNCPGYADSLIA